MSVCDNTFVFVFWGLHEAEREVRTLYHQSFTTVNARTKAVVSF